MEGYNTKNGIESTRSLKVVSFLVKLGFRERGNSGGFSERFAQRILVEKIEVFKCYTQLNLLTQSIRTGHRLA